MGYTRAFCRLFKHLRGRNLPVLSPIKLTHRNLDNLKDCTLNVSYKSVDIGNAGDAEEDISVVDKPEITVLAIGF